MTKRFLALIIWVTLSGWGFYAHQKINRLAIFCLPPEMTIFYKKHIQFITKAAVNPDRRRYTVAEEAPRHYIDLDHYEAMGTPVPAYWQVAVDSLGEDSLQLHGIVPWHITRMYYRLREAFMLQDPQKILKISAETGHYIADAHVPLHTTSNYDGQKTNQTGIHAFWESRLPELYFSDYEFLVGKAAYIGNVQDAVWKVIAQSHAAVDSVLFFERTLFAKEGERKFTFETKGRQTAKMISSEYSKAYHRMLHGMVERRLRSAIKMTADIWYTAWVDAGQPDLRHLIDYTPTPEEIEERKENLKVRTE